MATKKLDRSAAELFLEQAIRDGRATKQLLSTKIIKADPRFQSRVETDPEHSRHLASLMDVGIELRPVVVFRDPASDRHRLADGFHRLAAHKAKRLDAIWAYVIEGTERDVSLYSASANLENSKPTTKEDRKKAVEMLLDSPEFFLWNNKKLGLYCGLSNSTVTKIRSEYCLSRGIEVPAAFVCDRPDGGTQLRISRKRGEGVPRYKAMKRDNKFYGYMFGTRKAGVYLGVDGPEARAKFERLSREFLDNRTGREGVRLLMNRPPQLVNYLLARNVLARCWGDRNQWDFPAIVVAEAAFVTACPKWVASDIFRAVGVAILYRRANPDGLRTIVACYNDHDGGADLIALAECLGVEFMAPEAIVAEFASRPETAPAELEMASC